MKREFRRFFLNLRRELGEKTISKKSEEIFKILKDQDFYKSAQRVFVYLSLKNEVDTYPIIKDMLKDKKEVYVPKIIEKEMKASRLGSFDDLEDGKFSIKTTRLDDFEKKFDLILIPGLSFDKNKNRLGYGRGYYDRFLEESSGLRVGLFISEAESIKLPTDSKDVKLHIIITEERIKN